MFEANPKGFQGGMHAKNDMTIEGGPILFQKQLGSVSPVIPFYIRIFLHLFIWDSISRRSFACEQDL